MSQQTISGACLCGAVDFEFDLPSLFAAHCHCTMCRRAHGAGFVTWVGVRETGFRINKGESELTHFQSSEHVSRSFCRKCGSSMICNDNRHENVIDIALANLKGELDRPIKSHIFFDCRAGWLSVNDELEKRGGEGGIEPL